MASIPDPPGPGEEIAGPEGVEYEVGAAIREGWGGTLHAGHYRPTGRLVTVQDIRPDLAATAGMIDRLGQIGRQATQVRDPHLLAVYDLVDHRGVFRLAAEWSDAPTLAATLRHGSLPAERAVTIVDNVLAGLVGLHGAGLFHGQVGPETIVIEADGRARLAELAVCAAASPAGTGPQTDVRDAARLGLHLLRGGGRRLDGVRRSLDAAVAAAGAGDASRLREELGRSADVVFGAGWHERGVAARARPVKRRRRLVLALLAAAVVAAAAVAAVALAAGGHSGTVSTGPLVVGGDATLAVNPKAGGCNTTFSFIARGSLRGVGTLVYRWEQSDGQITADTSLPIGSTVGAFQLTEAWRLQGSQSVMGGMTLHILKPVESRISRPFRYSCP